MHTLLIEWKGKERSRQANHFEIANLSWLNQPFDPPWRITAYFLVAGCFAMREKQTNKKMSSLFSDVLAVINHRWLSEGNKTCAVMHLLFHGGLFSLNVVIYLFISVHVCVWELGPKVPLPVLVAWEVQRRVWDCENTGEKKRKKLFNVLFRLCICYPFVCMDICEHFILLDLERQQTSSG